jgi:hypothetical protein
MGAFGHLHPHGLDVGGAAEQAKAVLEVARHGVAERIHVSA